MVTYPRRRLAKVQILTDPPRAHALIQHFLGIGAEATHEVVALSESEFCLTLTRTLVWAVPYSEILVFVEAFAHDTARRTVQTDLSREVLHLPHYLNTYCRRGKPTLHTTGRRGEEHGRVQGGS